MSTDQTQNHQTQNHQDQKHQDQKHPRSVAEIEAEIEQLRHSVGATVEELTHRLDVKGRAQDRIRATSPATRVGAGLALAAVVALVVWRRRSASS